jgi:adenine-specific DNA glycosylase
MVRGLDGDLLTDLWNFPAAFGTDDHIARQRLEEKVAALLGHKPLLERLSTFRHTITYRSIFGTIYKVKGRGASAKSGIRWIALKDLDTAAISQLSRKVASRIVDFASPPAHPVG